MKALEPSKALEVRALFLSNSDLFVFSERKCPGTNAAQVVVEFWKAPDPDPLLRILLALAKYRKFEAVVHSLTFSGDVGGASKENAKCPPHFLTSYLSILVHLANRDRASARATLDASRYDSPSVSRPHCSVSPPGASSIILSLANAPSLAWHLAHIGRSILPSWVAVELGAHC
jgi:hypothetical protein